MSIINSLIRLARIAGNSNDDTKSAPVQQVQYLGKTADSVMVYPWGMHANVPANVAALMFSNQGNPDNRFSIPFNTKDRPELAANELAFFHPLLPDLMIKLKPDGTMSIESGVKINIVAPETEFTGVVKANGKVIDDTHQHAQGNDSGGNTESNITGVL